MDTPICAGPSCMPRAPSIPSSMHLLIMGYVTTYSITSPHVNPSPYFTSSILADNCSASGAVLIRAMYLIGFESASKSTMFTFDFVVEYVNSFRTTQLRSTRPLCSARIKIRAFFVSLSTSTLS